MLQNPYLESILDAKIGVDPAENEPSKVSAPNRTVFSVNILSAAPGGRRGRGLDEPAGLRDGALHCGGLRCI